MRKKTILLLFLCLIALPLAVKASDISGWAWSSNIGWISFNSSDPGAGGSPYKVEVNVNGGLSGYAWSTNVGWISFYRSDTGNPPSNDPGNGSGYIAIASPSGQLGKSNVYIDGWARALSYGGGWDGWIRFDHGQTGEAYIEPSYQLNGWTWGSDVIGWVSLSSDNCDSDGNGITDAGNYSCPVGQAITSYLSSVGGHLECQNYQCVFVSGEDCPPEGCCSADVDCCVCSAWQLTACGYGDCDDDEKKQIRTCDGYGCTTEGICIQTNSCYHTECNADTLQCELILGPVGGGVENECGDPSDPDQGLCQPMLWNWWEIIARQLGG